MARTVNAAKEIAVAEFLQDKLGFIQRSNVNEESIARVRYVHKYTLNDYIQTNTEARKIAHEIIKK